MVVYCRSSSKQKDLTQPACHPTQPGHSKESPKECIPNLRRCGSQSQQTGNEKDNFKIFKVRVENETSQALLLPRLNFHSAFVTFISSSSSLTGIQDVRTFIAFSKSESMRISRVPSMSAALVACKTSRPPAKGLSLLDWSIGSESPRSMNTSQTRSCAGKGIE